jgi:hypothetical protein
LAPPRGCKLCCLLDRLALGAAARRIAVHNFYAQQLKLRRLRDPLDLARRDIAGSAAAAAIAGDDARSCFRNLAVLAVSENNGGEVVLVRLDGEVGVKPAAERQR